MSKANNELLLKTSHRAAAASLCLLLSFPVISHAEELFVSDNLRVGVRDAANKKATTLTVVRSGNQVTVLKRKGSYIKIRTKSGVEGWVKSAYFSSKKPARALLEDVRSELKARTAELAELKSAGPKNGAQLTKLQGEVSTLAAEKQSLQQQLTQSQQQNQSLRSQSNTGAIGSSTTGALLFFLCLGFLFGISWYKRQVTKRLGGLSL
jgi:SH3 domain protein